jgi:hypothetical protein
MDGPPDPHARAGNTPRVAGRAALVTDGLDRVSMRRMPNTGREHDALSRDRRERLTPVFPAEPVDAPAGVENLLFAGVERVAGGADLDVQLFTECRSRREAVPAAAQHFDLAIGRMDAFFHGWSRGLFASVKPVSIISIFRFAKMRCAGIHASPRVASRLRYGCLSPRFPLCCWVFVDLR